MVTRANRQTVFNVMRNRAVQAGNGQTLVHLAPSMAYDKPRGPYATNAARRAWSFNMSAASSHVNELRKDALEILRTSDDLNMLKKALRAAWPNPRGTGSTALEDRDIFVKHWMIFLCLFRPRGLQIDFRCDYDYRVQPNQKRADAYASFLAELVRRQRQIDVAALHMTFPQCVREYVRAPRYLKGVFQLLCAMGTKRPKEAISELFDRRVLDNFDGVANADRRAAAWTRVFKLIRCIARTKAQKLAVLERYIARVRDPVARDINDLVRHAKSYPSIADQARFLWSVVHHQRLEPPAAVIRAVLGTMTRDRLARFLVQYARLDTRNRVQTRGSVGRLSRSVTNHITTRLKAWGVLKNSRTARR